MSIQSYSTQSARIGAWRADILAHAVPVIALGTVGVNQDFKKKMGKTAKFRRWLPKGSSSAQPNRFFLDATGDRGNAYVSQHLTTEGVTPAAETISAVDYTVQLNQYSVLYGYTDQVEDFYEDDVPESMRQLCGERVGLVNEMALFGVLKGCTNKFYGGTGTSRATVNGVITLTGLRKIARSLKNNHATTITAMEKFIKSSNGFGTSAVGRCYPVWIHTDLEADVRELPKFVPVESYGDPSQAVPNEFGYCEGFRFISTPELISVQDGGAAVAGTSPLLNSTTGTYADVYQVIVGSQDAWGHVGLNLNPKSGAMVAGLTPKQTDKNDPLGQRGYIGAKWYYNALVLNDLQMAVYEVGTRNLG
jgi:N4-gp56 family major capsid protein